MIDLSKQGSKKIGSRAGSSRCTVTSPRKIARRQRHASEMALQLERALTPLLDLDQVAARRLARQLLLSTVPARRASAMKKVQALFGVDTTACELERQIVRLALRNVR